MWAEAQWGESIWNDTYTDEVIVYTSDPAGRVIHVLASPRVVYAHQEEDP